jgi:hypothetical protein
VGLLVVTLALAACASPLGVVPDRPQGRYSLPGWPRQSISLEVVDVREQRDGSEGLVQVTTAILSEALAAAAAPPAPPQHLVVEIIVHDVSLQGPLWIGTTRFKATLFEGANAVRTWEARGEQRVFNWAPIDARTAIQQAYERGIAALVARMDQFPP